MAEAKALRQAQFDLTAKTKVFRQITDNHAEFFFSQIIAAYNTGSIDASLCQGWIPKGVPNQ
jgi:hypothetical protein